MFAWKATNKDHPDFLAISEASKESLLFGPQNWTIYNDSKECSLEGKYKWLLVMTSCVDDEFTCHDGSCIAMALRCNGQMNCNDRSDESLCQPFTGLQDYNKFLVPPPLDDKDKLAVKYSINIADILEVNEVMRYIRIKVDVKSLWYDKHLTFQNLKEGVKNEITLDYMNLIWAPWNTFENIENKEDKCKETDKKTLMSVMPNDKYEYQQGDNSYLDNTFLFEGSRNELSLEKQFTIDWLCDFQMAWYPFDSQSCQMVIKGHSEEVNFIPYHLSFSGKKSLPQHAVRNFKFCRSTTADGSAAIVFEVVLSRPLFSTFLTTTLPTGMLITISAMATAFSGNYLDMVIQVVFLYWLNM